MDPRLSFWNRTTSFSIRQLIGFSFLMTVPRGMYGMRFKYIRI